MARPREPLLVRIYTFADDAAPLFPKGTIVRITGTFDNTPANRNVVDPRNWFGLGHWSIDNMMNSLGEIVYLTDEEFQAGMVLNTISVAADLVALRARPPSRLHASRFLPWH